MRAGRASSGSVGWTWARKLTLLLGLFCLAALTYQIGFAQGGGLSVTASCSDSTPNPAGIGDTISATLSATAANIPTPPDECSLNSPTWSWEITNVQYSPDGTTWGASPGGDSEWIVQPSSTSPAATANSTFSDNDNDGGYWKITCTVTVVYTDTCEDSWQASGSADDKDTVVTISIWRELDGAAEYLPIKAANNNVNLLVGQYVNLWANIMPEGTAGTYQWTSPPGTTFYDYVFDTNTATLTKLPADPPAPDPDGLLTSSLLLFYWTDAADNRNVICTFTPNGGKAINATGTLRSCSETGHAAAFSVYANSWVGVSDARRRSIK